MSSLDNIAESLRDRFIEEQEYVRKYVDLLQRKTLLTTRTVNRIIRLFEKYALNASELLVSPSRVWLYKINELQEFNTKLQQQKSEVQRALQETETKLNSLERPSSSFSHDVHILVGESIDYLTDALAYDSRTEEIELARRGLIKQLRDREMHEDEPVFIGNDFGSYDELVNYSIKSAIYLIQEEELDDLTEILNLIEEMDIAARMSKSDTEINVYRQGFITLTTIFDATVFDLMKVALRKNFFNLIPSFAGKQDKLSLNMMGKFLSFETFRDEVIEDQLKSKYLKEILFILHGKQVILTDISEGDRFIHLLEMVLRRNIHIHNRGIVDSKYLETDESGAPRFNVYGLMAGTVAQIDSVYWERANRLSLNCIKLITDWINILSGCRT